MWKKPEPEYSPQPGPSLPARNPVEQLKERAVIGASIFIRGDISGDEDLLIQGRVEGKIDLKQHNVTVGKNGRVKADIFGTIISVEGEVQGNLYGEDKIVLRQTGSVRGNIVAPRVNLEDGSKFKGSIDMDANKTDRQRPLIETPSQEKPQDKELTQKLGFELKPQGP